MNEDPPGIQVYVGSPYKTVKELADAIKAAPPGKLKASGTGQGGIWHLALVGWLQAMGLKADHVAWVPSNGAAPAMQDLAAGGLDIVTCSVPEARALIEAGKARSLAIMAAERNPAFKDVPTLKEAMGIDYSTGAWRGFAAPKGLPAEIANAMTAALKKVNEAAEFREFMRSASGIAGSCQGAPSSASAAGANATPGTSCATSWADSGVTPSVKP